MIVDPLAGNICYNCLNQEIVDGLMSIFWLDFRARNNRGLSPHRSLVLSR